MAEQRKEDTPVRQLIIIGSGPAGYTAAIYAARANLSPLLIASSVEAGGELINTTDVENYPGFPEGVQGPQLMTLFQEQAERFGTEVVLDDAVTLELEGDVKKVTLGSGAVEEALTVIYATGSAYRKLGVDGEDRLSGRGVSWCATCDGFFFRDKVIAVAGGGDSAMEEATFLTKFASKVYIVHRSENFRASEIMLERARQNPKIEFLTNKVIEKMQGEELLSSVVLRDTVDDSESTLEINGLFIAVGSDPRVHLVHGQLDLTKEGTLKVDGRTSRTNLPGVFAAGDVLDPIYRQAVTAAGSGTVAALDTEHYLAALPKEVLAQASDSATVPA